MRGDTPALPFNTRGQCVPRDTQAGRGFRYRPALGAHGIAG